MKPTHAGDDIVLRALAATRKARSSANTFQVTAVMDGQRLTRTYATAAAAHEAFHQMRQEGRGQLDRLVLEEMGADGKWQVRSELHRTVEMIRRSHAAYARTMRAQGEGQPC